MHAFDRQTDRRTDRRTEISSLRPRCIPCSAVKIDALLNKTHEFRTYLHNETSVFSKYCDVKQHERVTLQDVLKTETDTLRTFLKDVSVTFFAT